MRIAVMAVVILAVCCALKPLLRTSHMPINSQYPRLRRVYNEPSIYIIDGFFCDAMCDELVRRARLDLHQSLMATDTGENATHESRVSRCSHFNPDELPTLARHMDRLAPGFETCRGNARVIEYEAGGYFKRHRDWYGYEAPLERIAILFVYLSSGRGGESNFTDISLPPIPPKKGRAVLHFPVFWPTLRPDPRTFHASQVAIDPKYILTTFWHSRDIGYIGGTEETLRLHPETAVPSNAPNAHRIPLKGTPL